ncbi:MAG: C1 family peptidase [Pirellulaceae bacterium]
MSGEFVEHVDRKCRYTSDIAHRAFGWQQSLPDYRDYLPNSPRVQELLNQLQQPSSPAPNNVDLREFFPPVSDQRDVNSCAACACTGLVEYFQRRTLGRTDRLAPLFLYKATRKLSGKGGDSGSDLRTTLKAVVHFGVPPLRLSNSDMQGFDQDPDAHLYSMTNEFRSMTYWRLDARDSPGTQTLARVRSFLAAGFPVVFGFPVTSLALENADILYRPETDPIIGGQAVLAAGYDDRRLNVTRGALLIRNSWGTSWGKQGYGWLPYEFIVERLAVDFWTVMRPDWLATGELHRPRYAG